VVMKQLPQSMVFLASVALAIIWPIKAERKEIYEVIHLSYWFLNCPDILYGILFSLQSKPTVYGAYYWTRKSSYALHAPVFCDAFARIHYVTAGWPGSVQEDRAWMTTKFF